MKDIKAFYSYLSVYCFVIPFIIFMNLKFEPRFHWFWFSTIGWATGVLFHWVTVSGFRKIGFGKDWEEKKIKELTEEQIKKDKNYG